MKKVAAITLGFILGACSPLLILDPKVTVKTIQLKLPEAQLKSVLDEKEIACVANTVYGEARGESVKGQALVAMSIISRKLDERWGDDACAVVSQPRQYAGFNPNFAPKEKEAYAKALEITKSVGVLYFLAAKEYREVKYFDSAHKASRFHKKLKKVETVGNHTFYSDRT